MSTLTDKYKPKTLDDIVGQDAIVSTLRSYISSGGLPHLLFTGAPGTCKTSTVHALARDIFGEEHAKAMTLELNGSDDRGISVIRTQIKNFSRLKNVWKPGYPRLIILDEADSLTSDAQSALRRVMEKYTSSVRFCLICNYITKLIPALQSRCTIFRFRTLTHDRIIDTLRRISLEERINAGDSILEELVSLSHGDLRRCLNFLEASKGLDSVGPGTLTQYFFGTGSPAVEVASTLVQERPPLLSTHKFLESLRSDYHLSLENIIDILTHVSLKNRAYDVMARLADIEYSYFKSHHTFEEVLLRAVAAAIST